MRYTYVNVVRMTEFQILDGIRLVDSNHKIIDYFKIKDNSCDGSVCLMNFNFSEENC